MKFQETSNLFSLNRSTYINLRWIGYIGQLTAILVVQFYLNFNKRLFYLVSLLFLSYITLLLIVYFSSPYNFRYHLETSAHRVLESLTLLLGFFALYDLKVKFLKETS